MTTVREAEASNIVDSTPSTGYPVLDTQVMGYMMVAEGLRLNLHIPSLRKRTLQRERLATRISEIDTSVDSLSALAGITLRNIKPVLTEESLPAEESAKKDTDSPRPFRIGSDMLSIIIELRHESLESSESDTSFDNDDTSELIRRWKLEPGIEEESVTVDEPANSVAQHMRPFIVGPDLETLVLSLKQQ